jgi:hypothetical protein
LVAAKLRNDRARNARKAANASMRKEAAAGRKVDGRTGDIEPNENSIATEADVLRTGA